ncbi:MAG TPA: PTS sugar transporter subunit IIA [Thermoanaerobaculia bacterium]|nr:PTS sugar transporter subunit IIA [Thermoanaerobaculia bacterium]
MKITITEAAALLDADEERVHDWIEEAALPAQRIRGQYRINRSDLLEWATAHNVSVAPRAFDHERGTPSLAEALRAGGVHDRVPGSDPASVLRHIVTSLPLADGADRDMLLQVLLARDMLGVTAVGDGIAIPHVRTPIILAPANAVLALSFLTTPLDLHAPDGQAVDTFFFLICPTVHVHLAMLAKLAYALKDPSFRAAVRSRAAAEEIIRIAAALEEGFR